MRIINKFGGEILGNLRLAKLAVRRIREQLKRKQKPVVVVSALAGVTDKLVKLGVLNFTTGVEKINKVIEELTQQHRDWAKRLKINNPRLEKDIQNLKQGLEKDLRNSRKIKDKLAVQDRILSYGEKFSSLLFTEYLIKQGIPAKRLTGEEIGIITDGNFGDANIMYEESLRNIKSKLKNFSPIPIITGFIGKTRQGQTTTLGRGGSDTTACLIGAGLNPSKVILWKNVPGVLSADPKLIKNPKRIKFLSYSEASESGKVLQPKAISLAKRKKVPIEVTYIADCRQKTLIGKDNLKEKGVKIISLRDNLSLLSIESEKFTQAGTLSEISNIISQEGINIVLIRDTEDSVYIVVEKNCYNLMRIQKKIRELGYEVSMKEVAMINAIGKLDWKMAESFNNLIYKNCSKPILGAFPYQNCLRLAAIVEPEEAKRLARVLHQKFL